MRQIRNWKSYDLIHVTQEYIYLCVRGRSWFAVLRCSMLSYPSFLRFATLAFHLYLFFSLSISLSFPLYLPLSISISCSHSLSNLYLCLFHSLFPIFCFSSCSVLSEPPPDLNLPTSTIHQYRTTRHSNQYYTMFHWTSLYHRVTNQIRHWPTWLFHT